MGLQRFLSIGFGRKVHIAKPFLTLLHVVVWDLDTDDLTISTFCNGLTFVAESPKNSLTSASDVGEESPLMNSENRLGVAGVALELSDSAPSALSLSAVAFSAFLESFGRVAGAVVGVLLFDLGKGEAASLTLLLPSLVFIGPERPGGRWTEDPPRDGRESC